MALKPDSFSSCVLVDFSVMNFKMNVCNNADQLNNMKCMINRCLALLIKQMDDR